MVVLLDLSSNDSAVPDCFKSTDTPIHWPNFDRITYDHTTSVTAPSKCLQRPNPNLSTFTQALSCYPIVSSLSAHLDLNDLHSLSLTCRQARVNLLPFRNQLILQTLHCENEGTPLNTEFSIRYRETESTWYNTEHGGAIQRATMGKIGPCARDNVAECRRCARIVCRVRTGDLPTSNPQDMGDDDQEDPALIRPVFT
jgi:hypothetical protein